MPAGGVPEVLVLQHQDLVGPGSLPELVSARGWDLRVCRLDRGDPLPALRQRGQILVVLGGTMGVADRDDPAFPWMTAELQLLGARLQAQAPVLGICLGAQMLAHAGGGEVEPLWQGDPPRPLPEVGCGAVQWHATARQEPVLAGLQACEPVFFWHGDRVRLPADAVLVGSSLACREQAFRLGPRAWGLQFHAEITASLARSWVDAVPDFVRRVHGPSGPDRVRGDLERWGALIEERNRLLLGNVLDGLAAGLDSS